jgi:hypothetical protein
MADEAGQGCIARPDYNAADFTVVSNATASAAGNVTRCAVYGSSAGTEDIQFAMLEEDGAAPEFEPKTPAQTSGVITDGVDGGDACYEFTAGEHYTVFTAEIGDYLACWTDSNQEIDTWGGADIWGTGGDNFLGATHQYTFYDSYEDALTCDISAEVGGVAPTSVIYGPLMGPMGGPI